MAERSARILSLDVFRGLTIALMILVNSLGTRLNYAWLEHAEWNGCTLADLVFPAFLFIVGVSTVISLKKQVGVFGRANLNIYWNILKRGIWLFLFGLLLNAFPSHFDFSSLRFYGVLQRIAACYLICSLIYLNTSVKTQIILFWGILLGYWLLLTQISMPGDSGDQLSKMHNWVGYVDQSLFLPANLYKIFDPEGLLSTIPSLATTLLGLIMGSFLLTRESPQKKCLIMMATGLMFLLLAWLWSSNFPINKNLWSSTFVLWTGGLSLITFAFCFYAIDISGYSKWATPFKFFGVNALFIYIFHVLLLKIQSLFSLPLSNGTTDNFRIFISDYLFGSFSQQNAGLFYALAFVFLNYLVAAFLYWRRIFIKL